MKAAVCACTAIAAMACAHPEPRPLPDLRIEDRARARELSRLQVAQRTHRLELLLGAYGPEAAVATLRFVGADAGPVPDFELVTPEGFQYSSRALVGREPFVAVFFATWCDYCGVELSALSQALGQVPPMPLIPVSADDDQSWPEVAPYLASYGLRQPAVRARDYPLFSLQYDPFDTVPVVIIVGRSGELVDYHLGYDPSYAQRLVGSLRVAHAVSDPAAPLAEQAGSRP